MKNPFAWLAAQVNERPLAIAIVAAAAFVVLLYGLTLVSMQTGNDTYLDPDSPRGAMLSHYTETYSSDAMMLIFESADITSPVALRYIDSLQEDITNEQAVDRVSGVVNMLRDGNDGTLPSSSAEVDAILARSPPEIVDRYMPSKMMTISAITLRPGLSTDRQKEVLNSVRTMVALSNPPPGMTVIISGEAAFSQEMEEAMGSSMGILIMAAMLLMVLAVFLLFSHVRYQLLPVVVVGLGLTMTFGFMGLTGIPISMVVIGAFPVLIGIGIDYAIQIHSRLDEEAQKVPLMEAITTTVTKTGPAVMIAMLATSMGFISMVLGPIPMIGDFGIICTVGVIFCYLAALVVVPLVATFTGYRPKTPDSLPEGEEKQAGPSILKRYDAALGSIAYTIAKHPIPVILLVFLVAMIGFQLDNEVPISADEKTFVPADMPALVNMNKVTRAMGATSTIPLVVSGGNVLDPITLQWIYDFGQYEIDHNDRITGVTSIATLVAYYNGGELPETPAGIKETLAKIPAETRDRYLNGQMETVLEFSTVDLEMSQARSLVDELGRDLAWHHPPAGDAGRITGTLEMFSVLMDDIARSKTRMTVLGFVFILAFLLVVYRRVRAATPLIPIVAIVGWNGLIMYVLGLEYTPLTAVLGSMTIGVASEYTILIMERVDEELERGLDLPSAIQMSVQKIGTAITVSGLTTVFGFAALMLSEFNIIANFGITTVITVGFSLCGAILIMPAIIALVYRSDPAPGGTSRE